MDTHALNSTVTISITGDVNDPSTIREYTAKPGVSIREWLQTQFPGFKEFERPTVCYLNGSVCLRKHWDDPLAPGDVVNFETQVNGIVEAIIIGVALIASAVIFRPSIPEPKLPNDPRAPDTVYTTDGQRNQSKLGFPKPVPYGRNRIYPDLITQPFERFWNNRQSTHRLMRIGPGVYDIEAVLLRDTPLDSYPNSEYQIYQPGEVVDMFPDNVVTVFQGAQIELYAPNQPEYTSWTPWEVVNDAGTEITKIEWDMALPQGLYRFNDDGDMTLLEARATMEYEQIDNNGDPVSGGVTGEVSYVPTMRTNTPQYSTLSRQVAAGRYRTRVRRTNNFDFEDSRRGGKLFWRGLRGEMPSTKIYPNDTVLAWRAGISNTIDTQVLNQVRVVATRKLPEWDFAEGEWANGGEPVVTRHLVPALMDVFCDEEYGDRKRNAVPTTFDLAALETYDEFFRANNVYFDHVFDSGTNLWEAAKVIARAGRATRYLAGTRISIARDELQSRMVALFGKHNTDMDSVRVEYNLHEEDEHDGIEALYIDQTTWEEEPVLCLVGNQEGNKPKTVQMVGIGDRERAYREGMYIAEDRRLRPESVKFNTNRAGIIPRLLKKIGLATDVGRKDLNGYVKSITQFEESSVEYAEVELSEAIDIDASYSVIYRLPDGSQLGPFELLTSQPATVTSFIHLWTDNDLNKLVHGSKEKLNALFFAGPVQNEIWPLVLVGSRPLGNGKVEIQARPYNEDVFQHDEQVPDPLDPANFPDPDPDLPAVVQGSIQAVRAPYPPDNIQVSWAPVPGARFYLLETRAPDSEWERIGDIHANAFANFPLQPGHQELRVAAFNVGRGPWTSWVGDMEALIVTTPVANLAVSTTVTRSDVQGDGQVLARVTLTWDLQADQNFIRAGHFEVESKRSEAEDWEPATVPTTGPRVAKVDMPGYLAGADFDFRVRYVDVAGNKSVWTQVVDFNVASDVPAPTQQITTIRVKVSGNSFILDWNAIPDAFTYRIWRTADPNVTDPLTQAVVVGEVEGTEFTYRDEEPERADFFWIAPANVLGVIGPLSVRFEAVNSWDSDITKYVTVDDDLYPVNDRGVQFEGNWELDDRLQPTRVIAFNVTPGERITFETEGSLRSVYTGGGDPMANSAWTYTGLGLVEEATGQIKRKGTWVSNSQLNPNFWYRKVKQSHEFDTFGLHYLTFFGTSRVGNEGAVETRGIQLKAQITTPRWEPETIEFRNLVYAQPSGIIPSVEKLNSYIVMLKTNGMWDKLAFCFNPMFGGTYTDADHPTTPNAMTNLWSFKNNYRVSGGNGIFRIDRSNEGIMVLNTEGETFWPSSFLDAVPPYEPDGPDFRKAVNQFMGDRDAFYLSVLGKNEAEHADTLWFTAQHVGGGTYVRNGALLQLRNSPADGFELHTKRLAADTATNLVPEEASSSWKHLRADVNFTEGEAKLYIGDELVDEGAVTTGKTQWNGEDLVEGFRDPSHNIPELFNRIKGEFAHMALFVEPLTVEQQEIERQWLRDNYLSLPDTI